MLINAVCKYCCSIELKCQYNILTETGGLSREINFINEKETFKNFFNDEILNAILKCVLKLKPSGKI